MGSWLMMKSTTEEKAEETQQPEGKWVAKIKVQVHRLESEKPGHVDKSSVPALELE